jgi:protein-L-isoaspartate(D-aspartate) O-methyltransferase
VTAKEMKSDFQSLRTYLVNNLRKKGITDENVLRVIVSVPREKFIDSTLWEIAYEDIALQIDCRQTISQPYTVAYMTMLLEVFLEIGTGSGYQAAILAELGAEVYSIERINELYLKSSALLNSLGYKVKCFCGDGTLGLPEFAPYNRIIVTAAAPGESQSLINQLANGGRMVIPIGKSDYQTMYIIEKSESGEIRKQATDHFRFVPLIDEEGWQK